MISETSDNDLWDMSGLLDQENPTARTNATGTEFPRHDFWSLNDEEIFQIAPESSQRGSSKTFHSSMANPIGR